ncbi:MAG: methyltransferase [Terracidiphilus sp.]
MKPPPNFNPLARAYKWMELASFGPWLWRCRCVFLGELGTCRNALILGDGDGRFTARFLRQNPAVQIDAVDVSRAMLEALARNAGTLTGRVRLHLADVRRFEPPSPSYDLIVTHFFLDCLTSDEVAALAEKLRGRMTPSARWLISEFAVPRGWFGRLLARPLIAVLYLAFGLLTGLSVRRLPNHRAALTQVGFNLIRQRELLGGLLISELWELGPREVDSPGA